MKILLPTFLFLASCATLQETALPRASSALDGLSAFYFAVCLVPPSGKEKVCEDARKSLNEIGEFYNQVNDAIGSDE